MRKKIFLYAALLVGSGIMYSSCNKVADLVQAATISWTAVDVSFDVPPITDVTNNTSMGGGTFTYNLDSLIKDKTSNQLGLSNIDQFTLSSCTLTIQNPDANNNFGNFESAEGDFATSANTTSVVIGSVTDNPSTYAATLSLPVNTTTNLKTYIASSGPTTFSYSVMGKARTATTQTLHVTMHVEYNIHVKP